MIIGLVLLVLAFFVSLLYSKYNVVIDRIIQLIGEGVLLVLDRRSSGFVEDMTEGVMTLVWLVEDMTEGVQDLKNYFKVVIRSKVPS